MPSSPLQTKLAYRAVAQTAFLLLLTGELLGCGGSSPNKHVSGQVTLDGVPIKQGVISLIPNGPGRSAGGRIIDGRYDIGGDRGPAVASYKVSISSMAPTGKIEKDPDSNETWPETKESVPARYNSQTELAMEVTEDGPSEFNFDLSSK